MAANTNLAVVSQQSAKLNSEVASTRNQLDRVDNALHTSRISTVMGPELTVVDTTRLKSRLGSSRIL